MVRRHDIPAHLHRSDLYRELFMPPDARIDHADCEDDEDDDDDIFIPDAYLKRDLEINTCSELRHLLETLRYWGFSNSGKINSNSNCNSTSNSNCSCNCYMCSDVDDDVGTGLLAESVLLEPVLTFCFTTCDLCDAIGVLREFAPQLAPLQVLIRVLRAENELLEACRCGSMCCLQWLLQHDELTGCVSTFGVTAVLSAAAAGSGHLCCLQHLRERGCPIDVAAAEAALEAKHEQCLEYLLVEGCAFPQVAQQYFARTRSSTGGRICSGNTTLNLQESKEQCFFSTAVAERGWVRCLQLLQQRSDAAAAAGVAAGAGSGVLWEASAFTRAAARGYAECMRFLFQYTECPRQPRHAIEASAYFGQGHCLQLALELQLPDSSRVCEAAALGGHIEALKVARNGGCVWNTLTCGAAAAGGHLSCLQYAVGAGCEWGQCAAAAARHGQVECLRYALQHGCPYNSSAFLAAAEGGHIECVQELLDHLQLEQLQLQSIVGPGQQGSNMGNSRGTDSVVHSTLHALQSLLGIVAARSGSLALLQLLSQLPWCRLTAEACAAAAAGGHLRCLQYLREQCHCPWTRKTCEQAARGGHLQCLRYATAGGCRLTAEACAAAASGGHLSCLRHLHEECECPWSPETIIQAASSGQLLCMQYAAERGCGWSKHVCEAAARNGHVLCLKYAVETGCPVSRWLTLRAEQAMREQRDPEGLCLHYILEMRINSFLID